MSKTLTAIRIDRVLLALAITFLVVDTYPHPSLGPGLVESFSRWGLAALTAPGDRL
jgi:hypothetical protein